MCFYFCALACCVCCLCLCILFFGSLSSSRCAIVCCVCRCLFLYYYIRISAFFDLCASSAQATHWHTKQKANTKHITLRSVVATFIYAMWCAACIPSSYVMRAQLTATCWRLGAAGRGVHGAMARHRPPPPEVLRGSYNME